MRMTIQSGPTVMTLSKAFPRTFIKFWYQEFRTTLLWIGVTHLDIFHKVNNRCLSVFSTSFTGVQNCSPLTFGPILKERIF